jgi:mRNA-degrading endonuclease RelE of RelBE toxin-antitoxin system
MIPSKIIRSDAFLKEYAKLPEKIQALCDGQINRLTENTLSPQLQSKKLQGHPGVYSFRVTRRYRTLFFINKSQEVVLFTIAHRKDVYRS